MDHTEVANVVLLNKVNTILQGELEDTKLLVAALNPRSKIVTTSFGKVQRLDEIIVISKGEGVAMDGVVNDHKEFVTAEDTEASRKGLSSADGRQ